MRSAGCQQVEDVTLTSHDCASSEKCTSICGNAEQLLELPPDASVRKHTSRDFKGKLNELDLAFDHLGCGLRKYLMQDFLRFVDFLVRYQMSWRLGTKWQNSSENNCRQGTKSNHISPSLRDFRESSSKCVRKIKMKSYPRQTNETLSHSYLDSSRSHPISSIIWTSFTNQSSFAHGSLGIWIPTKHFLSEKNMKAYKS